MSLRAKVLFAAFMLLAALACLRLGLWQLDRLAQRRAANAAALARETLPPLPVNAGPAGASAEARPPADSLAHRRLTAQGRFDQRRTIVLRGRLQREVPGVELVTPLRLAQSDSALLVLRGWAPSADARSIDLAAADLADTGTVSVTGPAFPIPDSGDGRPLRGPTAADPTSWRRLDLSALRDSLPYPILPVYLIRAERGPSRFPLPVKPPALDEGSHLSYAIQWFAFATIALVGGGIIVLRRPGADQGTAAKRPR